MWLEKCTERGCPALLSLGAMVILRLHLTTTRERHTDQEGRASLSIQDPCFSQPAFVRQTRGLCTLTIVLELMCTCCRWFLRYLPCVTMAHLANMRFLHVGVLLIAHNRQLSSIGAVYCSHALTLRIADQIVVSPFQLLPILAMQTLLRGYLIP